MSLRVDTIPARDAWPSSAQELGRWNSDSSSFAPPLAEVWTYDANAAFGPGPPLVFEGFIIVATRKGEVHAVDRATGRKLGVERLGSAIDGTPVLTQGLLMVPLDHGSSRILNAWNLRAGSSDWTVKGDAAVATSPTIVDDKLIVVDRSSRVRAFDPHDGTEVWSVQLDAATPINASPVIDEGGQIVIADVRGVVTQLNATGQTLWTASVEEPVYESPVAANGMIYLAGTRGGVRALDSRTGALIWSDVAGSYTHANEAPKRTPAAVDRDLAVFSGTDGAVLAYDATTGKRIWSSEVGAPVQAAPLLTRGHVFVATLEGRLLALERSTGRIVWEVELRGRVKSAMAAQDGDLFVLCEPRFLYRFSVDDGKQQVSSAM